MTINVVTDDFAFVKARVGLKLGLIPLECEAFSYSRPRRPMEESCPPTHASLEPKPECGYTTWTDRIRIYNQQGVMLHDVYRVSADDVLYVVGAGDHFFWPGEYVGRRLEVPDVVLPNGEHPVLETLSLEPAVFLLENFVSDEEANAIIEAAKPHMVRSQGFEKGKHIKMEARTSEQAWLLCNSVENKFLCDIDERISKLLRIPIEHVQHHSDALQVIHYGEAQHYHSHHDFFDPTLHPSTAGLKEGYNRMLTLIWYLTDVEEGGETVFPLTGPNAYASEKAVDMSSCERGLKVRPKKGSALLWYNMLPHGNGHESRPDRLSLHGGCDVIKGDKWASNKWIYSRKWSARQWIDTETPEFIGMARRENQQLREPTYANLEELEASVSQGAAGSRNPGEQAVEFVNRHEKPVKLFWVGTEGTETEMATIAVGGTQPYNSYVNHIWVARDIDTNEEVRRMKVEQNVRQIVIRGADEL